MGLIRLQVWLLAAVVAFLGHSVAFARVWTDVRGNTLEGEYVRMIGDQVLIRMKSGQRRPFPYIGFSEADREYIKGELNARGQGYLIPRLPEVPAAGDDGENLDPADRFRQRPMPGDQGAATEPAGGDGAQFDAGSSVGQGATPPAGAWPPRTDSATAQSGRADPYSASSTSTVAGSAAGSADYASSMPGAFPPSADPDPEPYAPAVVHDFPSVSVPAAPDFSVSMPRLVKECTRCGKQYPPTATRCENCESAYGQGRQRGKIFGAILLVSLIGAAIRKLAG